MYREFEKNFIDTGLVAVHYRPLIAAALLQDTDFLAGHLELATDLGRDMIRLYHSMDNRLRFTCEVEAPAPAAVEQIRDAEVFKDLRGVACPMNFVKTKVELARIPVGGFLRILLDDGEPADNVPRSVKTEGHEIVSQERLGGHWQVVIEKKV
ncbi:MAG: hypothetical protein ACD_75C02547G0001 [uncultured bacterium]|nr:MAG: hypothetical protein ACD_75C02547G0001 [uncultured bacterium]